MGRASGSQYTWLSTWLGRRYGQTRNYVLILCAVANDWLEGHRFGRKSGDKQIWRRGIQTSLNRGEKIEDICVPCKCSPKGDLSRRGF